MFARIVTAATAAYGSGGAVRTQVVLDVVGFGYTVEFHTGALGPWFAVDALTAGGRTIRDGRTYLRCTEVASVILKRELRRLHQVRDPKPDAVERLAHIIHIGIERSRDEFAVTQARHALRSGTEVLVSDCC